MSAERELRLAAQAKADQVVSTVADFDGGSGPYLVVSVTDPETNTRLATGFIAYQSRRPMLRVVEAAS
ncbi:hypothetical protein [Streptomyces sp. enrichment culture]|uniref:hypothetical protein n=1 Tax=Streptomyces sp. enrichment culture TaxID=1795815 RepID=UPI003F56D7C8